MLRYRFGPDRGHHALAWGQAQAYGGNDYTAKIKGNLAEIAFYDFCRHTLPIEQWHWHNGEALRRAEKEYCEHDFTIAGNTVDVKGRSRISDLFDLDGIDSDLVALIGIPSELADDVSGAEEMNDFAVRGAANYEPVVILGLVEREDINPESHELRHDAPGGPQIEQLPVRPADQLPTGIAITEWLEHRYENTEHRNGLGRREYEGFRQFHTSSNGQTLQPGSLVAPTDNVGLYSDDENFPDQGVVAECPDRPAGAVFNEDTRRYERIRDRFRYGRTPAVGVIDRRDLQDDVFETVADLCEEQVYPAVSQVIYNNCDKSAVHFTGASALAHLDEMKEACFTGETPQSDDWWSEVTQ